MKKLIEIGKCPKCGGSLEMYKASNYKRFVKCGECDIFYSLPKQGKLSNSALECPKINFPLLIVERESQPAYFWSDQPCFSCINFDKCMVIKFLVNEFKELKVYGYS
jgi:ssDNA-binding Zn-finger/Zn-ribbon topoisomerase 1